MPDLRRITFVALSSVLLLGTIYSVVHHTYLDTSDPLVALGHVKHALHDYSYFARKSNVLNTVFIKRAWGWTTAAFVALWATYPLAHGRQRLGEASLRKRLVKWLAATGVWLVFTSWFFGPAVFERLTSFSGGECVVRLPSGKVHTVPMSYCHDRTILSPTTHPDLFFVPPLALDEELFANWTTKPRLMKGHDVSGHIFLLTMSLLFLADMIRPSLQLPAQMRSMAHNLALLGTGALMSIWVFSIFTTSVYFHTPFEKLTGYLLGVAGYLFTQLPYFQDTAAELIRPREE
ncbi:inositol phospholipid synthesis and fat-storage-inducing TM-domain-containing protein [Phellopilus nigrolimitatus]|nr:inositol phospholipid synthesis and fat-storage-inducing TM-domain-containing protein [Phellopilus nigrolimitatus]